MSVQKYIKNSNNKSFYNSDTLLAELARDQKNIKIQTMKNIFYYNNNADTCQNIAKYPSLKNIYLEFLIETSYHIPSLLFWRYTYRHPDDIEVVISIVNKYKPGIENSYNTFIVFYYWNYYSVKIPDSDCKLIKKAFSLKYIMDIELLKNYINNDVNKKIEKIKLSIDQLDKKQL